MKRLSCLLLFVCCFAFASCVASQVTPVTFMTYNIRMGCGHDDPFKLEKGSLGYLPQCAKVIRAVNPDFVALQEIDRNTERAGGVDQTAALAGLCGLYGTFVPKVPMAGGDYGLAILSRVKPLNVERFLIPGKIHTRLLMVCEFADCFVANTHFPLSDEKCEAAAGIVCKALCNRAKPVILMGDFNSLPGSKAIALLRENFAIVSDTAVSTWPAKKPDRTIDYVMVDKAHAPLLKVSSVRVIPAPEATDHCAISLAVSPVSFSLKAGESKVLDFGPDGVGGYPAVSFVSAQGPARVRLSYATHPDGLGEKGDFWHETRANYMGDEVWLPILPASTDRFDVFEFTGAGVWRAPLAQGLLRYVRVSVERGAVCIGDVRLINDLIHSEEPIIGAFACSDERVNKAWRASVRTCQLAAIPERTKPIRVQGTHTNALLGPTYAFLSDGAKRDRLVWSGDLWFAQRNMYAAFAWDSPYMPGSIRMLAENHTPDGYVQACPYPESHGPLKAGEYGTFASDEFTAWFVPVVWDHILHTGDRKLAQETLPIVRNLIAYLVAHTGEDGIFVQRRETSKFSCGLAVGGVSPDQRAYMNILLWRAYRDAAALASWLGESASAAQWTHLAERTATAVRANFWDARKGCFFYARNMKRFCFEGSALALATHFATQDEASRILPQLKRVDHGKFQLLAVRGAFEYGASEKAMELVAAHNWFRYFDPSWKGLHTVYECAAMATKGWTDEAHPDACIAGVFTNYLLGIEPVEPGYRAFRVHPQPTKAVTSAEGRVSTPYGMIDVKWHLDQGKIVCDVRAPEGTHQVE